MYRTQCLEYNNLQCVLVCRLSLFPGEKGENRDHFSARASLVLNKSVWGEAVPGLFNGCVE